MFRLHRQCLVALILDCAFYDLAYIRLQASVHIDLESNRLGPLLAYNLIRNLIGIPSHLEPKHLKPLQA